MSVVARAENLSRLVKTFTPIALGILGVIFLSSPLRLAEGFLPIPLIPLIVVYFWSIYSPGYLPAIGVFFIGLMQDLLSGGPLGLWSSMYLLVQMLVLSQRSYFHGREQRVVWLGFGVIAALVGAASWLLMSMMSGFFLPVAPLMFQLATTAALYPIVASGFVELHRRVIVEV